MVRFDLGTLPQGEMWIAKLESAYNSIIIGPRGLQSKTNQQEIMRLESSDMDRSDHSPLVQGQMMVHWLW